MAIAVIDELPAAPDPASDKPQDFSQKAAAMVLGQKALVPQLNVFGAQVNVIGTEIAANAAVASSAAATAESAAQLVSTAAGAVAWASGTTYAKNALVISPLNSQVYRRRVAGAGTTDPANDSTNWALPIGPGSFIPQPVAASSINLALGNYFTRTMAASQTFTFDNCPQDGYSFTLELTVTAGVATLPTSVRTPDDVPYTLTTGRTHLLMFVTSNRGARWRLAAATNYAT